MQLVVIDASVALKWFVKNEGDKLQALHLLKEFKSETIKIVVPDLFFYEIANSLKTFIKAERITFMTAKRYLNKLLELNLTTVQYSELANPALTLANKLDISAYDASYLALAKTQKLPFYTADQKLLNKLPQNFKKAYSLTDIVISESN